MSYRPTQWLLLTEGIMKNNTFPVCPNGCLLKSTTMDILCLCPLFPTLPKYMDTTKAVAVGRAPTMN